jgi:hypothetical protein
MEEVVTDAQERGRRRRRRRGGGKEVVGFLGSCEVVDFPFDVRSCDGLTHKMENIRLSGGCARQRIFGMAVVSLSILCFAQTLLLVSHITHVLL